jgi:putative transposase
MDKSGANYASLAKINLLLILAGFATMIDICQVKYLNNIIEQDHRSYSLVDIESLFHILPWG